MPRILITGFEPFGGATVNPASLAVQKLENITRGSVQVITREIPAYSSSQHRLCKTRSALSPDAVISVGQAGGTRYPSGKVALSFDDARVPDNEENCPSDSQSILPGLSRIGHDTCGMS